MATARPKPSTTTGLYEAVQRFYRKSYFFGDYLGLVFLLAAYLLLQLQNEPFHTLFRLDDPRIAYPHAEVERVSVLFLFFYALFLPIVLLTLWILVLLPNDSLHTLHITLLGLGTSILLTTFLTDVLKNAIGRPRPDLLDRCQPSLSTSQHDLITLSICTQTDRHTLRDGFRSFPSGHSSFAFSGLGYTSLFLASQTHALRARANLAVVLLCLTPLLGAAMIAISRLEDYRHDVADVTFGSLLGFAIAYFNWRRYYPSLLSRECAEPYEAPTSGRNSPSGSAFQRVRDEEEGSVENGRFSIGDEGGDGREANR